MILLSRLKYCFHLNHKIVQRQFNSHAYNKFNFNFKLKREQITKRKFSNFSASIISKLKFKKSTIRFLTTSNVNVSKKAPKLSQSDIKRLLKLARPEKWKIMGT